MLLLYVLVRTGMLAVMGKVMLYGLLLLPLLLPILGAIGRYLVIPGQCPNCGVAFRAVRGAPPPPPPPRPDTNTDTRVSQETLA